MRPPRSLLDIGLLEDEPFNTFFLARAEANPSRANQPDSRKWVGEIEADLRKNNGLHAAKIWLRFAFHTCREEDTQIKSQAKRISLSSDSEYLKIFILFFWYLYENRGRQNPRHAAMRFLHSERTTRGYWYKLELEEQHEEETDCDRSSESPSPIRTMTSQRSPGRVRNYQVADAYDAEVSEAESDVQPLPGCTSKRSPSAVRASSQDDDNDQQIIIHGEVESDTGNAAFADADGRRQTGASVAATIRIVRRKRKAVAECPPSPAHSAPSEKDAASTPLLSRGDHTDVTDESMSTLSDLTDSGSEKKSIHAPVGTQSADPPLYDERRHRPQRRASNSHRLTELAKDRSRYEIEVREGLFKRGREETFSCNGASGPRTGPSTQKAKRGGPPTQTAKRTTPLPQMAKRSTPLPPCQDAPKHAPKKARREKRTKPSELCTTEAHSQQKRIAQTRKDADPRDIAVPRASATRKVAASRKPKDLTKNRHRKAARQDLPSRPAKRRRGDGDGGEIEAIPSGESLTSPRDKTDAIRDAGAPVQSIEATFDDSDRLHSVQPTRLKRNRTVYEDPSANVTEKRQGPDPARRLTIRLPRCKPVVKPTEVPVPRPTRGPASLLDVDTVVQQSACEALGLSDAIQHSTSAVIWRDESDDENHAAPPDSSDDETLLAISTRRNWGPDVPLGAHRSQHLRAMSKPPWKNRPKKHSPRLPYQVAPYEKSILSSDPRPRLHIKPPIWAESRQEVCESFEWFRSYQGGVYFLKDMVKGYLLSAYSASRDLFAHDGRFIVSHGGGKAESIHSKQGKHTMHQAGDQLEGDKSVRALLTTYAMKRPVALLVDDKYSLFPFDLGADGYTYVVLGFYRIAHVWAEEQPAQNAQGHVVRYKFAFQWCEEQGTPWWLERLTPLPVISPEPQVPNVDRKAEESLSDTQHIAQEQGPCAGPAKRVERTGPLYQGCQVCGKTSPVVYAEHWMCLSPNCFGFWRNADMNPPKQLTYARDFVKLLDFPSETLEDLRPRLPAIESEDGIITSQRFCKGWHCRQCGRLSSRYMWEYWQCKHCGAQHRVPGRSRSPKEFWSHKPEGFLSHRLGHDSGIIKASSGIFRSGPTFGEHHTYILPHDRGRIHLITSRQTLNADADRIFQKYQSQATNGELLFRRWPLRAHKCRGTLLTNYFSQNSGEPYQYVGGTDNTVAWDKAPSAVSEALELIRKRMKEAMNADGQFNEVLSAAYMEKQKMAFHSDSERGLGPTVASLSLGSGAYMYFRLLSKYSDKTGQGSDRVALTLFLRHGDVVVMEGASVQTYYEHTVVPMNFRIVATARFIDSRPH